MESERVLDDFHVARLVSETVGCVAIPDGGKFPTSCARIVHSAAIERKLAARSTLQSSIEYFSPHLARPLDGLDYRLDAKCAMGAQLSATTHLVACRCACA